MKSIEKKIVLFLSLLFAICFISNFQDVSAKSDDEKISFTISETETYGKLQITINNTSNVDGYRITYKGKKDSAYKTLATIKKDSTDSTTYVTKAFTSGTYSFRVRGYNIVSSKFVWGTYSEPVKYTIADEAVKVREEKMKEIAADQYPELYELVKDGKLGLTIDEKDNIYFTLGSYSIPDTYDNLKKKNIEWIVLACDEDNGKALLISRYILANKKYNNFLVNVSWETSSLRNWLNDEFLNSAFSEKERDELILQTKVKNAENNIKGVNGGNNTKDKIFLLSYKEANKYLKSKAATKKNLASATLFDGKKVSYWLRTPGENLKCVSYITEDGLLKSGRYSIILKNNRNDTVNSVYYYGVVNGKIAEVTKTWLHKITHEGTKYTFYASTAYSEYLDRVHNEKVSGVRPAMWISLK